MSDNSGIVGHVRRRAHEVGGLVSQGISDLGQNFSRAVDEAVSADDQQQQSAGEIIQEFSQRAVEVFQTVLVAAEEQIKNNEIDISVSKNEIRITGDDEGLKKIHARLGEIQKEKDLEVEYDRVDGISVDLNK